MQRALWQALKRPNVKPASFLETYNTRLGESSDRNERGGGVVVRVRERASLRCYFAAFAVVTRSSSTNL